MRIVFLNSLEKRSRGEQLCTAQVWIGEEQGIWRIGWDEIPENGETGHLWYEGDSWSEMLHIYRYQLAVKLGDGYRPVIEGVFHENEDMRGSLTQKLICYSELKADEELYNQLCAWRRKRAAAERKAPYLIASNRLLKLVSTFIPKNKEELIQLPGVGEGKAGEYGDDLLAMTAEVHRDLDFPLDWVQQELDEEVFRSWIYRQKEARFKAEMEKFSLRRVLLSAIKDGLSLEQIKETSGLGRREAIEFLEQLEKEGYDTDKLLALELAEMPEAEQSAVWDAYREMGDAFLKPVLQRVYGSESGLPGNEELERRYEQLRMIRIRYRRSNQGRSQSA
nr:HRDC domain-containing protein [Paenibacillus caui]